MSDEGTTELLPSEVARFVEVCRFGQDKLEQIATTVAAAFAEDPIWMWLYNCADAVPLETGMVMARMLVSAHSPIDEMHGFRHFGAVALWNSPDDAVTEATRSRSEQQMAPYREDFARQLGERVALTPDLGRAIKSARPEEPHWYLGILGTHPDRQNQGLGAQVLAPMHARCDRLGVPSFLVSSNPRNYGFYRRHGYVETIEFSTADSPPLLGFFRSPR